MWWYCTGDQIKTDVIVIGEFSMLDYYLFRTAEGLWIIHQTHPSRQAWQTALGWWGMLLWLVTLPSYLLWVGVINLKPNFGMHFLFWSLDKKNPVITSLHPSSSYIVIDKLANPAHKCLVPRFSWLKSMGHPSDGIWWDSAPCSELYCSKGSSMFRWEFLASDQTYIALSRRVRSLNDLVLWKFYPSAINVEPFYQQLLQWCAVVWWCNSSHSPFWYCWAFLSLVQKMIPSQVPYSLILILLMLIHKVR